MPNGQFGSRLQGGKDSASERYIYTVLNKITQTIFQMSDNNILKYLDDDGFPVEPIYYVPIIPMVLVNGSKGIGTGFSTDIMCYNPLEIIRYLKGKLNNNELNTDFIPYYEGFNGKIEKISESKFLIKGVYEKIGTDKIRVTELPVGYWTDDFKEHLENLIEPGNNKEGKKITPIIKDYDDMCKDTTVDFVITFSKGKLEEYENMSGDHETNGVFKLLKLCTTNTTTNMHLFNADDQLKKYEKVSEIIDDYFETRLKMYQTRKDYLVANIEYELKVLSNKARYVKENLDGTIDLRKKKKDEIHSMLQAKAYDIIDDDEDYKYLVKMPMDSVTEENVDKLFREHTCKTEELEKIKNTTTHDMWMSELENLTQLYLEYKEDRERLQSGEIKIKKKAVTKTGSTIKSTLSTFKNQPLKKVESNINNL